VNAVAWTRLAVIASFVALVEALCRFGIIKPLTLIAPSAMAVSLVHLLGHADVRADLVFTLVNVVVTVAISIAGGFAIGVLLHRFTRARRVVSPLLAASYAVPMFVFYPLMIVLFGLGRWSLIAIGVMLGIIGMIVNTIDGLDRIPRVYTKMAAMQRMSPLATTFFVVLPAAAPHLVTGVKLAVTYSITGVIAGEFILSVAGLGRHIALAYNDLDNTAMYGLLLLLLLVTTLVNVSIHAWEQRMHRVWGRA
jgi:NitT/TauT family transport system permease protein